MFQIERSKVLPLIAPTHEFVQELLAWALDHHTPNANRSQLAGLKGAAKKTKGRLGQLASAPRSKLPQHMATLAGSRHLLAIKADYERITNDYFDFMEKGAVERLSEEAHAVADGIFRYLYNSMLDQAIFWQLYPSSDKAVKDKHSLREKIGDVHPICPYCDLVKVKDPSQSTVDHFLAQDHFPVVAIYGDNLLAACHSCNMSIKRAKYIGTRRTGEIANHPIFHPLYHQAADHLRFEFTDDLAPVALRGDSLDNDKLNRAKHFIGVLELSDKYQHYKADLDLEAERFLPLVTARFELACQAQGRRDMALLQQVLGDVAKAECDRRWSARRRVDKTKLMCDFYQFLSKHTKYFAKDLKLIS